MKKKCCENAFEARDKRRKADGRSRTAVRNAHALVASTSLRVFPQSSNISSVVYRNAPNTKHLKIIYFLNLFLSLYFQSNHKKKKLIAEPNQSIDVLGFCFQIIFQAKNIPEKLQQIEEGDFYIVVKSVNVSMIHSFSFPSGWFIRFHSAITSKSSSVQFSFTIENLKIKKWIA